MLVFIVYISKQTVVLIQPYFFFLLLTFITTTGTTTTNASIVIASLLCKAWFCFVIKTVIWGIFYSPSLTLTAWWNRVLNNWKTWKKSGETYFYCKWNGSICKINRLVSQYGLKARWKGQWIPNEAIFLFRLVSESKVILSITLCKRTKGGKKEGGGEKSCLRFCSIIRHFKFLRNLRHNALLFIYINWIGILLMKCRKAKHSSFHERFIMIW